MKPKVRYENGEEGTVDVQKVEPAGEFIPPCEGMDVCCRVNGGRYQTEDKVVKKVRQDQTATSQLNYFVIENSPVPVDSDHQEVSLYTVV